MRIRTILFFGISLLLICCKPSKSFSLAGEISNNTFINKVNIWNLENNHKLLDSVTLIGNTFNFDLDLKNETILKVETNDYRVSEMLFFYEPDLTYTLKIKDKDALIQAPENSLQDEYNKLLEKLMPLNDKLSKVSRDTMMSNEQLNDLTTELYENILRLKKEHILNYPKSHVSLYLLKTMVDMEALSYHELNTFYDLVNNSANTDKMMLGFVGDNIKSLKGSRIVGKNTPEFALKSPENKVFTPLDFKGNYTLIDFWAGWCAPCRVANKKIIPLYNKYKEKGFNIVSISFDDDKESWLNAIKDDQITWVQLSDLKGFYKSPIKNLYNIERLPTTYVISPEGKVLDQNLTHAELEKLLEEIYK